jgi:hypothetical protein
MPKSIDDASNSNCSGVCKSSVYAFNFDTVLNTKADIFTLDNTPKIGDVNDYIGVLIVNSKNNYKTQAVRAANEMIADPVGDCDAAHWSADGLTRSTDATYRYKVMSGKSEFKVVSWKDSTWPKPTKDDWSKATMTDMSELSGAVTWTTVGICDAKVWETGACAGFTTWYDLGNRAPTNTGYGQFSMLHWLASEKPTDAAKVFQIEPDAVLHLLVNEHIGAWPSDVNLLVGKQITGGGDWTGAETDGLGDYVGYNLICVGGDNVANSYGTQEHWGFGSFTFDGASSMLGTVSVFAVLMSALF